MNFGDNRLPKRFWDKVQPEANTGCWLWTAGVNGQNRPHFKVGSKSIYSHRLTTELQHGPPPAGKECSHLCDQKLCVNPQHIIYETCQENLARQRGKPKASRGKPHIDRTYSQYAHLPTDEYRKAAMRERARARYWRKKGAKKCD